MFGLTLPSTITMNTVELVCSGVHAKESNKLMRIPILCGSTNGVVNADANGNAFCSPSVVKTRPTVSCQRLAGCEHYTTVFDGVFVRDCVRRKHRYPLSN